VSDVEGASVRIVRGTPDDVELAALVAGLAATRTHDEDEVAAGAHRWAGPARLVRGTDAWRPGPDAWRWSLRG